MRFSPISFVLLCSVLLFGFGCDGVLDVSPEQSVSEEEALSTPENVESVLVGGYSQLGENELYGGLLPLHADLIGTPQSELEWTGTFSQPREVWVKQIQATNSFVNAQWRDAYDTVNRANNVLDALEVVPEAERDQIEGEAKFLRAVAHFELVRLFGKAYNDGTPSENPGIPIETDPTRAITEDDALPRSSVEEVYRQVEQDLQEAKSLLENTNPREQGVFADTYVASAMLSRVYLMQGAHADAAVEANRVIQSGNYALMDNFGANFGNSGAVDETILSVRVTAQDNDRNWLNLFYGAEENQGRGDVNVPDAHVNRYEDGDARGDFFFVDSDGERRTLKWQALNAYIPIVRLAEMYLTRAEANFQLSESEQVGPNPIEDVNTIRERAGLNELSESELSLDDIWRERDLELAFEGHAIHDHKRTERDVGNISWDANRLVFPIPQREMDVNDALEQNPGY